MKKAIIAAIAVILILGIIGGGFVAYIIRSPECAMIKTIADVKRSGFDGLKKHLTDDTREKIEEINDVIDFIDNPFFSKLFPSDKQNEAIRFLKEKIDEIKWTVKDILKGKRQTSVVVGFNYNDRVTGTINIVLIKENNEWKIDGIEAPKIEKFKIN